MTRRPRPGLGSQLAAGLESACSAGAAVLRALADHEPARAVSYRSAADALELAVSELARVRGAPPALRRLPRPATRVDASAERDQLGQVIDLATAALGAGRPPDEPA